MWLIVFFLLNQKVVLLTAWWVIMHGFYYRDTQLFELACYISISRFVHCMLLFHSMLVPSEQTAISTILWPRSHQYPYHSPTTSFNCYSWSFSSPYSIHSHSPNMTGAVYPPLIPNHVHAWKRVTAADCTFILPIGNQRIPSMDWMW